MRDGDDWVINGSKIYITNAATADWLCLLAVTDPDAGYGGFSQIVVPTDSPGFSYQLLDKIGNWGSDTGLLFFEDVRVPVANTIGDIGRGFQQQMMQFQDERLVALRQHERRRRARCGRRPAALLRGARRLQEAARQDAGDAVQVRRDADADHRRARSSPTCASASGSRGEDATQGDLDGEALLGRTSRFVADNCIQLHGGFGYMKESVAGRAFVDTRLIIDRRRRRRGDDPVPGQDARLLSGFVATPCPGSARFG